MSRLKACFYGLFKSFNAAAAVGRGALVDQPSAQQDVFLFLHGGLRGSLAASLFYSIAPLPLKHWVLAMALHQ